MSKSRARLLAELLNTEGRVKKDRSDLAGADSVIDLDNLPTITNAKLENSSITIAGHSVSLGGSVSLDTADITEHTDYPYFTNARARGAISVDGSLSYNSSTGVLSYTTPTTIASLSNHDTDDLAEGTNLYFTNARARGAISVSGDLAYNSTTGVVSFTERTDAEVRGLVSASGNLSYNSSTGVFSYTTPTTIASLSNHDTDDLAEGANLYFTNARARAAVSASTGSAGYTSSTGVFTIPSTSDHITEGSNQFFTNARARSAISASGSLSYNSSTGVISYTQPTNISTFTNDSSYITNSTASLDASKITGGTLNFARIPYPVNGDWWNNGYVRVGTDGVMEVGKYLDFHTADSGGGTDYDVRITASSGAIDIDGDLTVDDITAGAISATSYSGTLASSVTGTTQSASDNSTKVATTAYVDSAVSGIVDSAPGTLNTLNELAAALGDDANFSTTVTNSIATKLPLAGGTVTGNLYSTSTASNAIHTRFIAGAANASTADGPLYLQYGKSQDISMFEASGANRKLYIYGNDNGTDRWGGLSVGTDGSFTVQASDTYLILQAASYIQSNNPHNFTSSLMTSGTTWLDSNRNATFNSLSSGAITGSGLIKGTYNAGNTGWSNVVIDAAPASGGAFIRANRASASSGEVGFAWANGGSNQWINYLATSGSNLQWYAGGAAYVMSLTSGGVLNTTGGYQVNGTTVIDSSRNLTNIATISASSYAAVGAIVASDPGSSYYSYNNRIGNGLAVVGAFNNFGTATFSSAVTMNSSLNVASTIGIAGTTVIDSSRNLTNVPNISNSGGSLNLGHFTTANSDQWPYVTWLRDTANGWDEGLIKGGSTRGVFGRQHFGIHFDEDRSFAFHSSSWDTEMEISGDGRIYMKGPVGVNKTPSSSDAAFDIQGRASTDGTLALRPVSSKGTRVSHVHHGANGDWYIRSASTSGTVYIQDGGGGATVNGSTIWHAGNDGSGSGLDADLLDGVQGSQFLRSDASDTMSGTLTFGSGSGFDLATFDIYGSMRVIRNNKSGSDGMYIGYLNSNSGLTRIFGGGQGSGGIYITGSGANDIKYNNSSIFWHAGNDGSGSGLDADTLDGLQGSSYWQKSGSWYGDLGSNGYDRVQGVNYTGGEFVLVEKNAQMSTLVDGDYFAYESGGFFSSSSSAYGDLSGFKAYDTSTIQVQQKDGGNANLRVTGSITRAGNTVWDSGNDGAGSGLDADTVDGYQYTNHEGVGDYQAFIVNGDTDKYYPVVITGGAGHSSDFKIWRGYNEYGPDDWNSSTHKGGLTFRYRISGSSGWGGYPNRIKVLEAEEIYTTLLGGINYTAHTMAHVVWLRGGGTNGARYHISSTSDFSLAIYTDTSSGYTSGSGWLVYDSTNNTYDVYEDYRTLTQRNAAIEGEVYNTMPVTYGTGQVRHVLAGTQPSKTYWNSSNDGSGSGVDADLLDGVQGSSFLRSDANDTASGQYSFTKTNDHAIKVGTIRGTAVGSQSGEYIHMYERVHIGGPSGWGASVSAAPSYGISTYGGADLAVNQGTVRVTTGTIASSDASTRGLIMDGNYTNGQYRHRWRKQDNGGGVPLYLDYAAGTANSYTQIARFGPYTSNPEQFEVYGAMKTNGQIVINQNIASPSNYYNGLQMEVRATSGTAGIGLHRNGYSHVGIYTNSTNRLDFDFNSGDVILMYNAGTLWGSGNDGSGSGLDADTVDGIQGSSILQTGTNFGGDVSGTYNAIVVANNSHEHSQLYENAGITYGASYLQWLDNNGTGGTGLSGSSPANGFSDWHHHLVMNHGNSGGYYSNLQCSFHSDRIHYRRLVNGSLQGAVELFHTGNDGSGSGLDADLLDGQHKAYFEMPTSPLTQNGNMNNVSAPAGQYASVQFYNMYTPSGSGNQSNYNVPEDGGSHYHVQQFNGYSNSYNNWKYQIAHSFYNGKMYHRNQYDTTWQGWATVWDSDTDGAGSGLDADLLDGQQGSYYNWRTWNDHITWNTGQNIYVSGESSIDVSGSGYFQVWDSGTGAPFIKCDVGQTVEIGQAGSRGLYVYGSITASGNVTAYSDIRLKENIEVIPNALEKVNQIRGVTFTRNDQDDKEARHTGVIAQEVEKVLPEVISEDNLGIKNVAYGNMVGLLIEAVKELKQEVDDLKAQLKEK